MLLEKLEKMPEKELQSLIASLLECSLPLKELLETKKLTRLLKLVLALQKQSKGLQNEALSAKMPYIVGCIDLITEYKRNNASEFELLFSLLERLAKTYKSDNALASNLAFLLKV